ncbi:hypothetical protein F4680DRAFT_437763 [Xylaria scruposa]|nr:hypothetical protein F4680DRAFT_437763 [Xylaria scruposa]
MAFSTFTGMVRASVLCVCVCIVSHKRRYHKMIVSNSKGACVGFGIMQRCKIHSVKGFRKPVETCLSKLNLRIQRRAA